MKYVPSGLIGTIGRFRTTSVVAPLYYPLVTIGLLAIPVTWWAGPDHLLTWMIWSFFFANILVIFGSFIFFLITNPERLQTEEYRLEQQRITLIGDERDPGKVIDNIPLTPNTAIMGVTSNPTQQP